MNLRRQAVRSRTLLWNLRKAPKLNFIAIRHESKKIDFELQSIRQLIKAHNSKA